MKKKKINWKAFKRMYRELGEYRIIEHRGKYMLQIKRFDYWHDSIWDWHRNSDEQPNTIESLTKQLLEFRYEKAKYMNKQRQINNTPKVKYTHP